MGKVDMPQDLLAKLTDYGVWHFALVLVASFWAGTTKYLMQIRNGEKPSFIGWVAGTCTSGFVGFVIFFACQYYKVDINLSVVIASIAAHNGTTALAIMTEVLKIKLKQMKLKQK